MGRTDPPRGSAPCHVVRCITREPSLTVRTQQDTQEASSVQQRWAGKIRNNRGSLPLREYAFLSFLRLLTPGGPLEGQNLLAHFDFNILVTSKKKIEGLPSKISRLFRIHTQRNISNVCKRCTYPTYHYWWTVHRHDGWCQETIPQLWFTRITVRELRVKKNKCQESQFSMSWETAQLTKRHPNPNPNPVSFRKHQCSKNDGWEQNQEGFKEKIHKIM